MPAGALAGLCPACLLAQGAATEKAQEAPGKRFEPPTQQQLAPLFPQLEVLSLLGAGGMGAVYKARQPALDRLVALKILPHKEQGPVNFSERFNREARALARLSHPHIVAVHEFGQAGGLNYFIMEYVDGANLRQLEKSGRLSPREAMQIIPQICDALQYAHDEGVVHRDIKPENVLVDRKGRVKIADFGLAKILGLEAQGARLTVEGQVMGTPHYMAPEQVERPLAVDHRADIYSLGVVLYEMLTGDLPLGKFAPPSRKVAVDVRLDEVVLRALENDPERRYQHASEVKSEIQTISGTPAPGASGAAPPAAGTQPAPAKPVERYVHWAGIPVVVDRGGGRHVIWDGGMKAISVGFLTMAVGLLLVWLITGERTGYLLVPSLFTLTIVGVGLWRALRAALPEPAAESKITPNGTVILSPKRWRLGWTPLAFFAIAGFPVLWAAVVKPWGIRMITRQPVLAAQTAVMRENKVLAAQVPGGAVELLAIGQEDPSPNHWWAPDGTLLTNRLFEIEAVPEYAGPRQASRNVILRWVALPEAAGVSFEVDGGGNISGGGKVYENGLHISGFYPVRFSVPKKQRSVSFRVGLGLEPWRMIATAQAQGRGTSSLYKLGDPNWMPRFHQINDLAEGAQVIFVISEADRSWKHRLIAVDTNGVEHVPPSSKNAPIDKSEAWTCTFTGVPLASLAEFRIQVRPIHWVEFRDLPLEPSFPLPNPLHTAFGPVQVREFTDYIDFDTGETREMPITGSGFIEGLSEIIPWVERNGIDASAGAGELQTIGMQVVNLGQKDWETLSPNDLAKRLETSAYWPGQLKPQPGTGLPVTFGFRTREKGTGILQITGLTEDRPGATVRFKLVRRDFNRPSI